MSYPAAPGLARVAERLAARGFAVQRVPGWESRGKGVLNPRGHVNHHTALPGRSNAGSLRMVTYGRKGLENALCTWFVARDGGIYLVSSGVSWHAGSGGWRGLSGNSSVTGTEAENDGVGEPWGSQSLIAQLAINAEMAREFGFELEAVCEHKEWTSRKIDRTGIDGAEWRRTLAEDHRVGTMAIPTPEEDDMHVTTTVEPGKDLFWVIDGPGLVTNKRRTWLSVIARDAATCTFVALGNKAGFRGGWVDVDVDRYALEVQREDDKLYIANHGEHQLGVSLVTSPR